ncbi:MAG: hypothetical protein SFV22_02970 [Saprospiraceae bacterium]|nr:hypothetical protein [Saprospiraceae bacterium]
MKYLSLGLFCLLASWVDAQSCGFTLDKCPPPLGAAALYLSEKHRLFKAPPVLYRDYLRPEKRAESLRSGVFLPRWSADQLPFFCKIEHDWAKGTRIPLKFRLGSVEYVDALEGH